MKKLTFNKYFLLAGLMTMIAGPVAAAGIPHTFTAGGTIKASEMNDNFTAVNNAISNIALTPGPAGPAGPAGPSGFIIKDAGTYVGQVGLAELGNFSLLTGAGGATGTAAADAACAASYPGSHAELDILALWKSAMNGDLPAPAPAYAYWASTVTEIPVGGMSSLRRTTDCDNWSNNATGQGGFVRPSISSAPFSVDVQLSNQGCSANNMAVACYTTP